MLIVFLLFPFAVYPGTGETGISFGFNLEFLGLIPNQVAEFVVGIQPSFLCDFSRSSQMEFERSICRPAPFALILDSSQRCRVNLK